MTLRRVDRVTVENWRSWQGEFTEEIPGPGIVVLHGPNAVGKTGLWEAMVAGLLDRHWGTHTARLRPAGTKGVLPRVEVEFHTGNRRCRVEKRFGGSRDKASFWIWNDGDWRLEDQGEEAYLLCRRAVLGTDESAPSRGGADKALKDTLMEVLLPPQGDLTAPAPAPAAVSMAVTDREVATSATRLGRILARVRREVDEVWVGTRKRPKKGSDLERWESRCREIEGEIEPLETKASQIRDWVVELAATTEELAGRGEARDQIELVSELQAEIEQHRAKRESVEKECSEAVLKRSEAEALMKERTTRMKTFAGVTEAVGEARRKLERAQGDRRRIEAEQKARKTRRDQLSGEVARHEEWIEYEGRETDLERLRRNLHRVGKSLAILDEQARLRAEAEAERASLPLPSAKEWKESDELQRRLNEAEGRLMASAWSVTGELPAGTNLRVDGSEIEPGGIPCEASRTVEIVGDDGRVLHLAAPAGEADEVEILREKIAAFMKRFGVEGLAELRERNDRVKNELIPAVKLADKRMEDALEGGTRDDLLKEQLHLEGQIRKHELLEEPVGERPAGVPEEWRIRRKVLEENLEAAGNQVEAAERETGSVRERERKAGQTVKAAEQDLELAKAALATHRERQGDDETREEALFLARKEAEGLEVAVSLLQKSRRIHEDENEKRVKKLTEDLGEVFEDRNRIQNLQARIETLRHEDPEGRLATLEAERAGLLPRIRSARANAEALRILESALQEERDRVTDAIGEPVRERLQRWVAYLLQDDSRVAVDETGRPSVIRTPAGRDVPFEDQSFGTREQVSILYRLAVADLVAEEAGNGVCLMLDDPFGHTDRGRRGRLLALLASEAERRGHQVLIFTCRPEDFQGVGTLKKLVR